MPRRQTEGKETMMQYLIVIEKTETGYSAYSPDLLGCVSTGATREEVEQNMREAVEFHLDGLKLEGIEIPKPTTSSAYIEVAA
jgi:predicted RNase H-like HicB family nuclease